MHPELWVLVAILFFLPAGANIAHLSATSCWLVLGWSVMAFVADLLFVPPRQDGSQDVPATDRKTGTDL